MATAVKGCIGKSFPEALRSGAGDMCASCSSGQKNNATRHLVAMVSALTGRVLLVFRCSTVGSREQER